MDRLCHIFFAELTSDQHVLCVIFCKFAVGASRFHTGCSAQTCTLSPWLWACTVLNWMYIWYYCVIIFHWYFFLVELNIIDGHTAQHAVTYSLFSFYQRILYYYVPVP
jgi:hypothetical protein